MLESEMMRDGISFLQNQYGVVKREVPFLSRCIDIVLFDNNNEIVSIEFKVSKWREAIEQARDHKLGADKAYICLPQRQISKVLTEAVTEVGIGLLLFDPQRDEQIYEVIPAPMHNCNVQAFRTMLVNNFNKV